MKFWEALKEMENGKCIYCPGLNEMPKWYLINNTIISQEENLDLSSYIYLCLDREWEIYEGIKENLSFQQALQLAICANKIIKRKNWNTLQLRYSSFNDKLLDNEGDDVILCIQSYLANDWTAFDR